MMLNLRWFEVPVLAANYSTCIMNSQNDFLQIPYKCVTNNGYNKVYSMVP